MPWLLLHYDHLFCITMQKLLILSARQSSPLEGWPSVKQKDRFHKWKGTASVLSPWALAIFETALIDCFALLRLVQLLMESLPLVVFMLFSCSSCYPEPWGRHSKHEENRWQSVQYCDKLGKHQFSKHLITHFQKGCLPK